MPPSSHISTTNEQHRSSSDQSDQLLSSADACPLPVHRIEGNVMIPRRRRSDQTPSLHLSLLTFKCRISRIPQLKVNDATRFALLIPNNIPHPTISWFDPQLINRPQSFHGFRYNLISLSLTQIPVLSEQRKSRKFGHDSICEKAAREGA